ncbi:hypothetical protein D3C80_1331820 [compost metagenome]
MRHDAGHAVDHAQGHQSLVGKGFDIRPECAEMMRAADGENSDAVLLHLLDQQRARGEHGRLGEAAFGIDTNEGWPDIVDFRHRLAIDPAAV